MSDILVLCYHAVSDRWPSELAVTPARLEHQLQHLIRRGYQGATFTDAVTTPPAQRTVVVTFDDAYRSVGTIAAPILERLGLPGTVFVPTSYVGTEQAVSWSGMEEWVDGEFSGELVPMNASELRSLIRSGWEVGSHTHTHPHLPALDDDTLRNELTVSRTACEQITGATCRSLAYPYGDYDERVRDAAERAGYVAAATLPRRWDPHPHVLSWPRIYVARNDGDARYSLKIHPLTRKLKRLLRNATAG